MLNPIPPTYIYEPLPQPSSALGKVLARAIQFPVQAFIWLFLSPRRGSVGNLTPDEVMSVYDREARRYDAKHHFTTRGQDTVWRREAAWCVLNRARNYPDRIRVLDLCTGTGLTVAEIVNVLSLWHLNAEIIGVDLNEEMLAVARKRSFPDWHPSLVRFEQADVTKARELPKNVDIVTQVFGIGGVPHPKPAFEAVLESLNENGQFYLVDMHRPIPELPGEMPLLWRWWKTPLLEATTYVQTTMPLALARLWGWRDTTLDFYRAPLATTRSPRGTWYGFEIVWFKHEAERWWFGLPVMPTARLLLKKVSLTSEEASQRRTFLRSLEAPVIP